MARSRRLVRAAPQRRKFVWARCHKVGVVAASDHLNFPLLTDFQTEYGAQLLGATVMRIRGRMSVWPPPTSAALDMRVLSGIRIYTEGGDIDQQSAPADEPHADWMAWHSTHLLQVASANAGFPPGVEQFEWDVKAARKLEELGQGLLLAVSNTSAGIAANVDYDLSIGLKLP